MDIPPTTHNESDTTQTQGVIHTYWHPQIATNSSLPTPKGPTIAYTTPTPRLPPPRLKEQAATTPISKQDATPRSATTCTPIADVSETRSAPPTSPPQTQLATGKIQLTSDTPSPGPQTSSVNSSPDTPAVASTQATHPTAPPQSTVTGKSPPSLSAFSLSNATLGCFAYKINPLSNYSNPCNAWRFLTSRRTLAYIAKELGLLHTHPIKSLHYQLTNLSAQLEYHSFIDLHSTHSLHLHCQT